MGFFGQLGTNIKKSVSGTTGFFSTGVAELKKVRWPNRKEMVNYTTVVLVTVVLVTLYVFVIDMGLASLFDVIQK
ncbi:protein translocase subunit secE/sec61 gamma [Marininema mesophilum]|uniref:Protein translocase subunit SecE n=1 Tax=Marininema mesophilum TaxID=1048340 RepID=A0A1H2X922_9BACL|nr:preprotein translocase subunit SecE [Marininema mesophilum]SDW89305.1 protein translocase subunit secE/sec61 gamma [Marininema mesophilum]